ELQEEFQGDNLAKQFEQLEYKGNAEQALLELKRKMGVLPPAPKNETRALGAGAAAGHEDVHDAELLEDGDTKA
ncbi:MAG TPA: hypothetical protein VFX50_13890, partial [Gemmatimonadales bacterium]|nr:hypothetical protein [Gemmatimonadales bacterium]